MRRASALAAAVLLGVVAAACGSDDGAGTAGPDTTTTTAPAATTTSGATGTPADPAADDTVEVLVTNDDGVGAPGIDALVEALRGQPGITVTVVAPAENQSGSSDRTTAGGPPAAVEARTASGFPARAVAGFPADAVDAAFDQLGLRPDLVISGINAGQNIGPIAEISGTVGAARTAARHGVPAIAVSAGLADEIDYPAAVAQLQQVLDTRMDELLAGPPVVLNLNVPSCTVGMVRGLVEVPLETKDRGLGVTADCTSTAGPDFADDVEAFVNGYAALADAGY